MAGKIVHFELPAADADRATAFWSGLFGWRDRREHDGGVRLPHVPDRPTTRAARSCRRENAGSGLIVYFDTDDIDASVAKVRELGGTADDKQPVPTHGWFAACKDTEGNNFSLWQNDPNAA